MQTQRMVLIVGQISHGIGFLPEMKMEGIRIDILHDQRRQGFLSRLGELGLGVDGGIHTEIVTMKTVLVMTILQSGTESPD